MAVDILHLRRSLTIQEKIYSLAVILFPTLATVYVLVSGMLFSMGLATFILLIIFYSATVLGVTVGFHRLLTHRSFKANRYLKIILTCLGCMSYEGPPFFWVAAHRRHHKFTDLAGDPHSPCDYKKSKLSRFYHAHIGWMLYHKLEDWKYYISDLLYDKDLRVINRHYALIAISGLIIPGIINGLIYRSWYHFYEGIMICGLFRVFLQQQVTWAINSVCHIWGKKDFETKDNSKNNWLFGLLAYGEGWHNGHHAFPSSAKHGLCKFQIDVSYRLIQLFRLFGLAWDIKVPSAEQVEQKKANKNKLSET